MKREEPGKSMADRFLCQRFSQFAVLFFPTLGFFLGRTTNNVQRVTHTGTAHIRAEDLHGIHYRNTGTGTGNRHEQWEQEVTDLQLHAVGQRFALCEQVITAEVLLGIQHPGRELQHTTDIFRLQALMCSKLD